MSQSKELTPIDALVMRTFDVAVVQHAIEPVADEHTLVGHLSSEAHLVMAATAMLADSRHTLKPSYLARRGVTLVAKAKEQSYGLLGAARDALPESVEYAEIPDILRASTGIGRVFGAVSGTPRHPRSSNDDLLLSKIMQRPDMYLRYDAEGRLVKYSEQGRELLRPHLGAGAGCPALHQTVRMGGEPINLFDAGWADFTGSYIQDRVNYPRSFGETVKHIWHDMIGSS